jgi:hypothetical protein
MQMDQPSQTPALERLTAFLGEWSVEASFPDAPRGRTAFEWLPGEQFMVQRWEVAHPSAPDGIAIIGLDADGDGYLQHYFDSRGVARMYAMGFSAGVWTLTRDKPDFTPLGFSQRFRGVFGDGGETIQGRWETRADGSIWEPDFDVIYTREQP